jgi:hypothetical protein
VAQDVQEKLDEEQKGRVKFQKQLQKTDEELRQARLKIDDLNTATSDQYVALKRLQEENSNQHRELESQDEKYAQLARLKKQVYSLPFPITLTPSSTIMFRPLLSFPTLINACFQCDVQISDLKAQLDETVASKIKVEKVKRDLESRVEELESVVDEASTKVSFSCPSPYLFFLLFLFIYVFFCRWTLKSCARSNKN